MREGIPCPRCAAKGSLVMDSRPRRGAVRRRRQCHKCGYRFSTQEAVLGTVPPDFYVRFVELLRELQEFVDELRPDDDASLGAPAHKGRV